MLGAARRIPDVEWQHGSALDMPFSDGDFDVVLCQQGLQFFADRAVAMREIARVLAPGGRLAANVWGAIDRQWNPVTFVTLADSIPGPCLFTNDDATSGHSSRGSGSRAV
jgi:ubiquinone/menaquinone biosynthesis C-methylase UbiE